MVNERGGDGGLLLDLDEVFSFVNLLNDFREVERTIKIKGSDRPENDVEHSYSLAMLAWYLIKANKLSLDFTLVTQYALIHDLVEVYAGDTFIYGSAEDLESKHKREQEALEKLKGEFPKFPELTSLIDRYDQKMDDEARFVYALDKLHPVINIFLDEGRSWHEENVTLKMILDNKTPKVALDPTIKYYFDELVTLLKKNKNYLPSEE